MDNFTFTLPTKVYFGDLDIKLNYKKCLFVYGEGSIKKNGVYERVVDRLKKNNIKYIELNNIKPNADIKKIYEGIEICKKEDIDLILAVGGGSVIDSAKAISIGAKSNNDIIDIYLKKAKPNNKISLGVVLTIAGAGSETNNISVISKDNIKYDYAHGLLYPTFAILNPSFSLSLNYNTSIYSIVDAITHILERYISNTKDCELSDNICKTILKSLIKNAKQLKNNLNNYKIREEIMLSCMLAHNGVCGLGKKADWSSHIIAHKLYKYYQKPHGLLVGIVMNGWIKYVFKINSYKKDILELFDKNFETFLKSIDFPTTLPQIGIKLDETIIKEIALLCENHYPSKTIGNYVRLDKKAVIEILRNING